MAGNLTKRILFGVVAIPVTVGIIWLGGWWLAAMIAVLAVLGAREVYDLARRQGIEALREIGFAGAAVIPLAAFAATTSETIRSTSAFALMLWLLVILVFAMRRGPQRRPLAAVSVTAFGALYAAAPLAFLIPIRHQADGHGHWPASASAALVLLPLVLTWLCDTFAYMVGSKVGGPKMAPVLSPNKTWSGAVSGWVAAIIFAGLLGQVLIALGWNITLAEFLLLGAVIGVVAQVGDVAESLLKREAGVKDSSNLIPGHGGVLDRLDSLYFVIPVSAALYRCFGVI